MIVEQTAETKWFSQGTKASTMPIDSVVNVSNVINFKNVNNVNNVNNVINVKVEPGKLLL